MDSEFHTVTTLVIVYFYIPQKNLPEHKLFYTFEDPHQPIFTNSTHVYYKATMPTHHITLCIRHVFTACLREIKITNNRQLCELFTIFLQKAATGWKVESLNTQRLMDPQANFYFLQKRKVG